MGIYIHHGNALGLETSSQPENEHPDWSYAVDESRRAFDLRHAAQGVHRVCERFHKCTLHKTHVSGQAEQTRARSADVFGKSAVKVEAVHPAPWGKCAADPTRNTGSVRRE